MTSKNTVQRAGVDPSVPLPAPCQDSSSQPFDINVTIGWILQSGVLLSAGVICVGVALVFLHPEQLSNQELLAFPHTLGQVKGGLLALHPQALIALGLLLLIATPVIRVIVSIVAFTLEHDRRYVAITTIVLAVLLISFLLGKGAG